MLFTLGAVDFYNKDRPMSMLFTLGAVDYNQSWALDNLRQF